MFQKLQDKWKVSGVDFLLIFLTFAAGGSLCGIAAKKLIGFTGIDKGLLWFVVYIFILTLIWPLCVLLISIPLGQFQFFRKYIGKIVRRVTGKQVVTAKVTTAEAGKNRTDIAIFASGAGSNAAKIIEHFRNSPQINVALVVTNKPTAGVVQIATAAHIPVLTIEKSRFFDADAYLPEFKRRQIDWIILAGFLWKIPAALVKAYPRRIINIHPALLPKYGGKGMYGSRVHEAVIAAGEKESGITIHYVDEIYDNGEVIRQSRCEVTAADTPESLAAKIHSLEHENFPQVIAEVILQAKN